MMEQKKSNSKYKIIFHEKFRKGAAIKTKNITGQIVIIDADLEYNPEITGN